MEWIAIPFSRGSSQPRDQTHVSITAGRFFTVWATREVQICPVTGQLVLSTWRPIWAVKVFAKIKIQVNQQSSEKKFFTECVLSCFSRIQLFLTLWTVACQALLSMGFSRQECWNGLTWPPPENLPDPRIKPESSALQADSLPRSHLGSPLYWVVKLKSVGFLFVLPDYTEYTIKRYSDDYTK